MFQPSKTNNLSLRKEHPQLLLIKSLDNIELVGIETKLTLGIFICMASLYRKKENSLCMALVKVARPLFNS